MFIIQLGWVGPQQTTNYFLRRHLRRHGKQVPKLEPASVTLSVSADGISTLTVFFVQPDSSQDFLVGMNLAPALGLSSLDGKGAPLRTVGPGPDASALVSLVQTKAIPARSRSFIEASIEAHLAEGACVLFEPDSRSFGMLGLGALESLLCVNQGKVLIPVENFHPRDVHMDAGTVLGQAEVVQAEVPVGDLDKQVDESVVAVIGADVGSRKQNLVETVKWPSCLTADELARLKQVVA